MNLIENHQELDETHKLYLCELHFKPADIKRFSTKTVLQKDAIPILYVKKIFMK